MTIRSSGAGRGTQTEPTLRRRARAAISSSNGSAPMLTSRSMPLGSWRRSSTRLRRAKASPSRSDAEAAPHVDERRPVVIGEQDDGIDVTRHTRSSEQGCRDTADHDPRSPRGPQPAGQGQERGGEGSERVSLGHDDVAEARPSVAVRRSPRRRGAADPEAAPKPSGRRAGGPSARSRWCEAPRVRPLAPGPSASR